MHWHGTGNETILVYFIVLKIIESQFCMYCGIRFFDKHLSISYVNYNC